MAGKSLDELRARIDELDAQVISLAAERVGLARDIAAAKREGNLPTVDFSREAQVLERARQHARALGIAPQVAEDLVTRLIVASISAQDEATVRVGAAGAGKRAVIVGGAGRMGRWMGRFLSAHGYQTGALDPHAPEAEREWAERELHTAELVVCSAPPATIAALYAAWESRPPSGLVVDIASIKSPLIEPIARLRAHGVRVASIHPMFGPSILLLRDADVVICDTGDATVTDDVEALFRPTTARIVHIPLADHDRVMADLLSLAHATAIAFALALPESQHAVRSTTFHRLESLAAALVRESPDVYYEIQSRNPHSAEALQKLRDALDRVVAAAQAASPLAFRALFEEAQARTPR